MKKEIKGFICGVIATSLIGCVSISATGVWDKIDVLRNDINVVVNDTSVSADNFLYNDTTYLPMRAVAEALGKDVQYDETTNTATIKDKGDNNLSGIEINNNTQTNKNIPSEYARSEALIQTLDNINYIEPSYICVLANEQGISTNVQELIGTEVMDLKLGNKTWTMVWINMFRLIPFDTFIDEILPYLGIDPAPYIQ